MGYRTKGLFGIAEEDTLRQDFFMLESLIAEMKALCYTFYANELKQVNAL